MRPHRSESQVPALEPSSDVTPSPKDVEAVINPHTGEYEPVVGFEIVEKESIMMIRARPSGVAMGALMGILNNGQEAHIFPTNWPEVASVGIIPLPITRYPGSA
jgi:hypothetical protein